MIDIVKNLLIGFFAVAVLLPVVRFALRTLSPARNAEVLSNEDTKYIQKKEWRLMIAYFFFATVLSVFGAGALAMLSSILHMSKEHMFVLTPNFSALFAPGLLLGLTLALLPLRLAQRALLGYDYDLYKTFMRQQEGERSNRAYAILLVIMLLISGIVAWFALQWHVTIDEKQLQITNLLQQERTYNLQDITKIQHLGHEGQYLVDFNDGTNLNTTYLKPVQLEMIALLAERSGHRVIR
ncbi:hypothetical protein [Pontibacter ruber]|uniref:Uncharacterized protein n=1 Tax=Pontibacter ruber TaxID=1343895 RepID=A0ABW5CXN6_9BACT|nr:hypothetical protein [Pontibacter ruber]